MGDNMRNKNGTKDKEKKRMATITKPRQSTIIKRSKTKDFFALMNDHTANANYWNNCAKSQNGISQKAMNRLKELCSPSKDE